MRNWIKNLYKIYLIAFALVLFFMGYHVFQIVGHESIRAGILDANHVVLRYPEIPLVALMDRVIWPISSINSLFFNSYKTILLLAFVFLHAFILWGERSAEQREFLATLPVKKYDRKIAVIVMDIALIVSTAIIVALSCYLYISSIYAQYDIHIPWLAGSICGLAVTAICYMVALVGIMHFIESLVVRGDMKIIVALACLVMIYLSVNKLFEMAMYDKKNILQEVYGFVNLCMVGGCYYIAWDRSTNDYGYWTHKQVAVYTEYKGETGITSSLGDSEMYRLVDFSNANSYIWYALSYLLIGFALLGFAVCLVKRQELSRSGFYFHGGVILVGFLISITFFSYAILYSPALWNSILIAISSVIIFAAFVYFTDKKNGTATAGLPRKSL